MSGAEVGIIITALSTLIGVMGGILVQLRGQDEARADRLSLANKVDKQASTIQKLEINTNSIKDALVEETAKAAEAAGHAAGLEQGRNEQGNNP
jgi:hypothetical protein